MKVEVKGGAARVEIEEGQNKDALVEAIIAVLATHKALTEADPKLGDMFRDTITNDFDRLVATAERRNTCTTLS